MRMAILVVETMGRGFEDTFVNKMLASIHFWVSRGGLGGGGWGVGHLKIR